MDLEQLQIFKVNVVEKSEGRVKSFHEVLGPILTGVFIEFSCKINFHTCRVVSQLFAHLPVSGVLEKDCKSLYFKWTSPRLLYTLLIITLGTFEVFTMIKKASRDFSIVQIGEREN